jgi:hypothetical protein
MFTDDDRLIDERPAPARREPLRLDDSVYDVRPILPDFDDLIDLYARPSSLRGVARIVPDLTRDEIEQRWKEHNTND